MIICLESRACICVHARGTLDRMYMYTGSWYTGVQGFGIYMYIIHVYTCTCTYILRDYYIAEEGEGLVFEATCIIYTYLQAQLPTSCRICACAHMHCIMCACVPCDRDLTACRCQVY